MSDQEINEVSAPIAVLCAIVMFCAFLTVSLKIVHDPIARHVEAMREFRTCISSEYDHRARMACYDHYDQRFSP